MASITIQSPRSRQVFYVVGGQPLNLTVTGTYVDPEEWDGNEAPSITVEVDNRTFHAQRANGNYQADINVTSTGNVEIKSVLHWTIVTSGPTGHPVTQNRTAESTKSISVVPYSRQPITVTLDNQQDRDPPVAAAGARIKIPPVGANVLITANIGSPTQYVEFQTSLDGYVSTTRLRPSGAGQWSGQLSVSGGKAPSGPVLLVRDVDVFGDARETSYNFWLDDTTPPQIEILEPTEDRELYLAAGQTTLDVPVHGTVADTQSHYQTGTLTYTFNDGVTTHIEPDTNGGFRFVLSAGLGPNRVVMTANDQSGNQSPDVTREFTVASKYKPKTIDELLGRRSYLADLIRFAGSHVLDGNRTPISSALLSQSFMPNAGVSGGDFFGTLADPGSDLGERVVNDLLPAVFLLRTRLRGLLVQFGFEMEQGQETPDSGPKRRKASLTKPGMIKKGALELNGGNAYALMGVGAGDALSELGKDNADFSVSFWILVHDTGSTSGPWRGVLYKGHEHPPRRRGDANRTFAIWLYPDSNVVHYRISTTRFPDDGGHSVQEIPRDQWTHVSYVKRGGELELFLNGKKDSWVALGGPVVANSDDIFFGHSPPDDCGFKGALDEVRIYDFALAEDDIRRLARDRPAPRPQDFPVRAYLRATYEALLVAHGTSYEEVRALPATGTAERRAIAERLGLTAPDAGDDGLESLVLPGDYDKAGHWSDEFVLFENWLVFTFGLPSTKELVPPITTAGSGRLLAVRQDYLARQWQAEDAADASARRVLLDPDLVERSDLNPDHTQAIDLLTARQAELEGFYDNVRAKSNVADKFKEVYSQGEVAKLAEIEAQERRGEPIAELLPPLGLTMAAFRRIRFYQLLGQQLSDREEGDLAHLLTQAWKIRDRYPGWGPPERGLSSPLWPNSQNAGAFVTGNVKREFLPWRGTVADRSRFEKVVSARMRAFEALADAHERAVLDAQRHALPLFRDRLLALSDLPSAADVMDGITERLLVDVASTAATTVTLVDRAAWMLQSLINGIRLGRFEAGHPASKWTVRTAWEDAFDEEWTWMGSYASWRSAKTAYLYPENKLFPELRTQGSQPYPMSIAFSGFLKALRQLVPSVPSLGWIRAQTTGVAAYEHDFFVPVAVGVMLERAGLYSLALDWYRMVYETRKPPDERAIAQLLKDEKGRNQPPRILYDEQWTLQLDPHTNASRKDGSERRFGNPYTRFVLARITRCLAALADAEFARGTDESRIKALDLYLEAKEILAFDELRDLPPGDASEGYLPNPAFGALRDHVAVALRKLRRGLTYVGTPALPDISRSADGMSLLTRPTPYRFRVLVDRAKQLLAQTQNLEAQYLSALEKRDDAEEKYRREAASLGIAAETVNLRALQQTEAQDGVQLANEQKTREMLQRDQFVDLIARGPNQHEQDQVTHMSQVTLARDIYAGVHATASVVSQAVATNLGIEDFITFGGAKFAKAMALVGAAGAEASAQIAVNQLELGVQLDGIYAAQERREEEWKLQRDGKNQDVLIANEQVDIARDRKAIAEKEYAIAVIQRDQARDMLKFLNTKFTSVEFYEWMIGVLAEVYAFLLRTATTVARHAEGQLAFERQQAPANLIKQDYWNYVSQQGGGSTQSGSTASSTPDRRGITASAQLLQDVTSLDQYAFDTERRLLNLSHTISLSRLFPIEFEEFRRTGLLSFATTMRMFDEGFPGHYMRLIKKVRIAVVALIPPNQGIRAALSASGLSRVVTDEPSFPTVVVRHEPQSVALTSAAGSTGVFELDMQSEMLYPFEGTGVDASWYFELPPAGNPFDFGTLFDVIMTIDYTALNSYELRERVVKQLPREVTGDRAFSVRRDLPDTWYELANRPVSSANNTVARIAQAVSVSDFPPQLQDINLREVALMVRRKDGQACDFKVKPSLQLPNSQLLEASESVSVNGIVSSRQPGAATWRSKLLVPAGAVERQDRTWNFDLSDAGGQADSVLQLLRDGEVDDILIVFTFAAMKPAWPT